MAALSGGGALTGAPRARLHRAVTSNEKYLRMFLMMSTSTGILMPSVCAASAGHET